MYSPESLAVSVSAIAVALAQGKTIDEIAVIAAVFTQLADTLTTIAGVRVINENQEAQIQEHKKKSE